MLKPFDDGAGYSHHQMSGPYRAISQFDALLPENNYQEMKDIKKKDFFKLLQEKFNEMEGDN